MPLALKRLAVAGIAAACPAALAVGPTTQDGAFTVAQAERGRTVYEAFCISCHEREFYETKLPAWQSALVADLFDALGATMPPDNPGSLSDAQYLDVLAYIFSITGSPAGDVELGLDTIASIEIVLTGNAAATR